MFARKLGTSLVVAASVLVAGAAGTTAVAAAAPACTVPTVAISAADQYEGSGGGTTTFRFTVRVTAGYDSCGGAGSVRYRTIGRGAEAGSDFTATTGTLGWQVPGSWDVTVPVNRDSESEYDESFSVELYAPENAVVTSSTATVSVLNDDAVPEKDIPEIETSFTPTGGICWWPKDQYLWVPLQTNVTPRATITVHVYGKDGTATSGKDYKLATGTVTFAEGVSKTELPVEVLGSPSGDLYFHVVIKDVSAGVVVEDVARVTIKEC